jgi:hypothetical protein
MLSNTSKLFNIRTSKGEHMNEKTYFEELELLGMFSLANMTEPVEVVEIELDEPVELDFSR